MIVHMIAGNIDVSTGYNRNYVLLRPSDRNHIQFLVNSICHAKGQKKCPVLQVL